MNDILKEDKLLLAMVHDRAEAADTRYMLCHTGFLDLRQRSLVEREFPFDTSLSFYGGYDDAERTVAFFRPEYIEEPLESFLEVNPDDNPLCWLKIDIPGSAAKLSHRDYLGSILGMGIKREKIGDILVRDDGADIVVMKDIAEFLAVNYEKAGRTRLEASIVPSLEMEVPRPKVKRLTDTVASLRLDSVLSSAFGLSRSKAADAVRRGIVFVNSAQIEKIDEKVKEGDRLVIRGSGKAKIAEIGGKSRKDRIYITIERYI